MKLRHGFEAALGAVAAVVQALSTAAVWSLASFRLGRLLLLVSLPRLREHRLRSSLTVLGIALGVAILVAVVLVNESIVRGVTADVDELAGKTDLQISAGTSGFSESLIEAVRSSAGVVTAVPALQQTVSVRDQRARGERLLLLGVDMLADDDHHFRDYRSPELEAIQQDPLPFLNSAHHLLLGKAFAARYGYALRDQITLATSAGAQPFEIWGFIDDRGVGSAFGGAVAVMYYQAMQAALARGENVDRIDVAIAKGVELSAVEAALSHKLGTGFVVEPPSQKGARIGRMLLGIQSGLTIASLIALIVGAFLIHNTMAISVVQRKREIGILRALGTRRREIVRLFTLEGALLGAVGSCLGVSIGLVLSNGLLRLTSDALNQSYLDVGAPQLSLNLRVLIAGAALGTLAATLASANPARRAARDKPAQTLQMGNVMDSSDAALRFRSSDTYGLLLVAASWLLLKLPAIEALPLGAFASAAALLAASALLLPRWVQLAAKLSAIGSRRWLSAEARLATENLPRDLRRTAVTAGAVMAGVALAVGFGTFTHSFTVSLNTWMQQTLPGDLFITQGAAMAGTGMRTVPMDETLYAQLLAMPEVEGVRRVRIVELPFRGYTTKAVSNDIDVFLQRSHLELLEGRHDDVVKALHSGAVVVSENFARHFRTHRGDHIALSTGSGTQTFAVAGVFVDYTSDVGTLLFDRPTYVERFHDSRVDTYEVYLRDPGSAEAVRRKVQARLSEDNDMYVLTSREFHEEIGQTTDRIFSLVRVLELVALIVAVMGIVNTQFANVLDRARELAVLRALGMLRKQLRHMIVIESALIATLGALAGVLLGLAFGYLLLDHVNLVQTGWYFPYRLSVRSIVEVTCLTIPAAALAGLYPAAHAARLNISEALESE
jgi:putative ABC transport system permease protein